MIVCTIGFTKKSAQRFFKLLDQNGVRRLIDTRLNPHGQLSGFSKQADLIYFLDRLSGIEYLHLPELAPTEEILQSYRASKSWSTYVNQFDALMDTRQVPNVLDRTLFEDDPVCLLCSEATPERCHRRLIAERLARVWSDVEVRHLV